jgi:hypothetical protein
MTLKYDTFIKNSDMFLAYFMLCLSLIYSFLQFLTSKPPSLAIIFFFISLLYIILSRKNVYLTNMSLNISSKAKIFNELIFIISFSILAIMYLKHSYPYPIYFYLILTISATSILISIYTLEKKYYWNPFFKIIILVTFIRASIFYQFPDIYGIDPLYHYRFCEQIISTYSIPKEGEFLSYSFYPIYHIILVQIKSILFISLRNAMFLMGMVQIFIVSLFIYLIGKKFDDIRTLGLLSIFIFCSCANVVFSGIALIPNTFSLIIYIVLFYMAVCVKNTPSLKIILIICLCTLILTHPYPPLFFIFAIIVFNLSRKIYKLKYKCSNENIVPLGIGILLTCLVLFISNLVILTHNPLFSNTILNFFIHKEHIIDPSLEYPISYTNLIYSDLSHNIILGIALFGVFFWINPKNSTEQKFSLALLAFSSISVLFLINLLNLTFIPIPDRIWPFAYIPISIVASQGIKKLGELIVKKTGKYSATLIIAIILLTFFVSITSPKISPDISLNANSLAYREALTSSETDSWKYAIHNSDQSISTDLYYQLYAIYKGYNNAGSVYNQNTSTKKTDLILSREYSQKNSYLRYLLGKNYYYLNDAETNVLNKIYDNGDSWVSKWKK